MRNSTLVLCPYCKAEAELADSSVVYGRSYGQIYICSNYPKCDAYVGVHKGTSRPKGRLADSELRAWKVRAHNAFDHLWENGSMTRNEAYGRLAEALDLTRDETHIGEFDVETCRKVVKMFNPAACWKKPRRSV